MNTQRYLDKFVANCKEELGENLSGIYLHGSLAMGCFNPDRSDIDLIVVIYGKLADESKKRMAKRVLELVDEMPNERGLEFSVVLEQSLNPFVYPTPCEFHYSDYHKERYKADEQYICGGYDDYDLAAQFVVAYERGVALYGKQLKEIYPPIDNSLYLSSIYHDIEGASGDILEQPMYMTLNLCRVLYFLQEGEVSSKKEGGEWGMQSLPPTYHALIQNALTEYTGMEEKREYDQQLLASFADYMLGEIKRLI